MKSFNSIKESNENNKLKYENIKIVELNEWDKFVQKIYGKPYSFQQQDGCQPRGIYRLTVPSNNSIDNEMHDSIPEKVNGDKMGVKFNVWLKRDSKQPIKNQKYDWELILFWKRNFYPNIDTVANDLYNKGLIEKGEYIINIDW